jgi:hypothetical protein
MGKNPNTFQKRQREMEKKRKAEDKRKRKQAQKTTAASRPIMRENIDAPASEDQ